MISKYDTWLTMIIGTILGYIPILLIAYLNKKNKNLFELISDFFGKKFAKVIKFILVVSIIYSMITLLYDFVEFTNVKYLFETPNFIISLIFMSCAVYICHKGSETLGRTALFFFYINVFLFFLNSIALTREIEINNLKPFLVKGILPLLKAAAYYVTYAIIPIVFLGIIPKNNESYKKFNKALILGYTVSSVFICIIAFYVTSIYNYEYISLFAYPAYFTLKKIHYGFIANIENIVAFYFIIDYFFTLLILLYTTFYFMNKELNIKGKALKISTLLVTLAIIILTNIVYKDTTIAVVASKSTFIIYNLIFLILFFSIMLIRIKTKRN